MTVERPKRLTRAAWLAAGLAVLRDRGEKAMQAEPMARHLGTTKGSFYWHFKDVADFHTSLLAQWEAAALADLVRILEGASGSAPRLRALSQSFVQPDPDDLALATEPAIRTWAASHEGAAQTVTRVDEARLYQLAHHLADTGIANPEMARILYAATIGMTVIPASEPKTNAEAIGSLVDLVLALR